MEQDYVASFLQVGGMLENQYLKFCLFIWPRILATGVGGKQVTISFTKQTPFLFALKIVYVSFTSIVSVSLPKRPGINTLYHTICLLKCIQLVFSILMHISFS